MQGLLIFSILLIPSLALRRVSIGFTNPDRIEDEQNQEITFNVPQTLNEGPSFITEGQVTDDLTMRTLFTTSPSMPLPIYDNSEEIKMKQVNIRPRGGKLLQQINRRIIPYTQQKEESMIERPGAPESEIFNDLNGNSYTKEELMDMCAQAKSVGDSFGIKDITSFAGNNCGLIQLYYSNVSCEEIGKFVEYCETSNNS